MGRGKGIGITLAVLAFVLFGVWQSSSQVIGYGLPPKSGHVKHIFEAKVLEVNNINRDGVTRIVCELTGTPHTSDRIDRVVLKHKDKATDATDIDGIDFNRFFQWEDNGLISVEIDFPRNRKIQSADSIFFHTSNGVHGFRIGKAKGLRK